MVPNKMTINGISTTNLVFNSDDRLNSDFSSFSDFYRTLKEIADSGKEVGQAYYFGHSPDETQIPCLRYYLDGRDFVIEFNWKTKGDNHNFEIKEKKILSCGGGSSLEECLDVFMKACGHHQNYVQRLEKAIRDKILCYYVENTLIDWSMQGVLGFSQDFKIHYYCGGQEYNFAYKD